MFKKLTEHENELKRLAASEINTKKKEKVKEEKWDIFLNASSFKGRKLEEDDDRSRKDYSEEEEMCLFVNNYDKILKTRRLKHYDKNLINFKRSHL